MIEKIDIKNFQAHEHSSLEFSHNLTAILGTNNHGKSAVLKAMYKVIRNSPDGNTFIRDHTDRMDIILSSKGHTVTRTLDKSKGTDKGNVYKVDDLEFVKFGRNNIPREIREVLPLSDIQTFGDVDIDMNFQQQLDGLFLITGTGLASTRSKVLGKITGADVAQRAVQICGAKEKDLTGQINKLKIRIGATSLQIEKYSEIDHHSSMMSSIGTSITNYDNVKALLYSYSLLQNTLLQLDAEILTETEKFNILSVDVSSNMGFIESYQNQIQKIKEIINIDAQIINNNSVLAVDISPIQLNITNISATQNMISLIQDIIEINYQINVQESILQIRLPEIAITDKTYMNYQAVHALSTIITDLGNQIVSTSEKIHDLRNVENNCNLEYGALIEDIGICPTCDRPFMENL